MSDAEKKGCKVLDQDKTLLWVKQGKAMSEKDQKIAKGKMVESPAEKAARLKEQKLYKETKLKFKHGGFTKRGPCKK